MSQGVKQSSSGSSDAHVHPRSRLVERFVVEHGTELMRLARAHAASAADADDAYQRTLEVMLTKAPETAQGDGLMAWAVTVARNETRMQHRRRQRLAPESFEEITSQWSDCPDDPAERLIDSESVGQGREALKRLDADQTRLLLLRADGLGYDEICGLTGFSYAKVNRLLCEARKSFRARVERIDSGAECRRIEGILSMIADGEVRESARLDAELHLKNCLACRATLREFSTVPIRVAALLPVGTLADPATGDWLQRVGDWFGALSAGVQERLAAIGANTGQGAEMAFAKKAVVATAVTATLVAGGAGVESVITDGGANDVNTQQQMIGELGLPTDGTGATGATATAEVESSDLGGEAATRDLTESDVRDLVDPAVNPVPAAPLDPNADAAPAPGDAPADVEAETQGSPQYGGLHP